MKIVLERGNVICVVKDKSKPQTQKKPKQYNEIKGKAENSIYCVEAVKSSH